MNITYQKFHFTIEAIDEVILPYYKGSTFRGGFGITFKKVVCALKRNDCKDCILRQRCVYAYVFETFPPDDTKVMGMNKYLTVPHPFVIQPPAETRQKYKPGEILTFSLILIGKAVEMLPYFVYTFEELGKTGIGKGRGRYKLLNVENGKDTIYSIEEKSLRSVSPDEIYLPDNFDFTSDNPDDLISLRFLTPARIMYQRDLAVDLMFHILLRSLVRRLGLLYYFHCGNETTSWDYKRLIEEAEDVTTEKKSLKWYDWERFSTRQNVRMKMGGIVGEITYRGRIEQFLPVLKAGEILHVGKGTSFGLGRYEINSEQ
ncbi:MAG: CRISPR system precrRNA processing endoribonuclease RAMP protein Cas6 [Nitrospira sp.]|nr:CRISPR system precrRNA processing endoribonuclease RAMP protein Cas6 [Nitrospira sp.]